MGVVGTSEHCSPCSPYADIITYALYTPATPHPLLSTVHRWYLCNLTGGDVAPHDAAPAAAAGPVGGAPQSDMLMDMGRRLLAVLPGAPPAQ